MKVRIFTSAVLVLAMAAAVGAQDQNSAPPDNGGAAGMRGGRDGMGRGGGMGMGRGVMGTVTEAAADHFTVKTEAGEVYTVHFSANTRIMKQPAGGGMRGSGSGGGSGDGRGEGRGWGGNPPQQIKASDIKVGDAIGAMGEVDASAKSVGAVAIVQMDPERARQLAEAQANYGKTWLMGRVTAIDGTKVTIQGNVDNAVHSFVADENTTFRKRRDPVTLADVQVGDVVRAEGSVKGGIFTAVTVSVMSMPPGGGPRVPNGGPQQ